MSRNSTSNAKVARNLVLLFVAVGICLGLWIVYKQYIDRIEMFSVDGSHLDAVYEDKLGTFVFFESVRECMVVIVTDDPAFSYHNFLVQDATYDSATLLAGSPYEIKVTEAHQKLLFCIEDDRMEFPISEGWILDWVDSLEFPPDGRLEDLNLLAEIARALRPAEREKLKQMIQAHGSTLLDE